MAMKKNLENRESEQHWKFVERASAGYSEWPSWKKAQYAEVIGDAKRGHTQENEEDKGSDS